MLKSDWNFANSVLYEFLNVCTPLSSIRLS